MRRQLLFLLLFPLALFARRGRMVSTITDASKYLSENTTLGKGNIASASTIEATRMEALPDAPGSLSEGDGSRPV